MKKALLLTGVLLVALFLSMCGGKNEEPAINATNKIVIPENLEVIENGPAPQYPQIRPAFQEDLRISETGWFPSEIMVDDESIFVFSEKDMLLSEFSSTGSAVSSHRFRRGQGPGEFDGCEPCLGEDGMLRFFDFSQRRLTILNKACEVQKMVKLDFYGQTFRIGPEESIYSLTLTTLPGKPARNRVALTAYSPQGVVLHEIADYEWGQTYNQAKGKFLDKLFRPQLKYKVDSSGRVYFAMSDSYEINVVSPAGVLLRRIRKSGQARPVTQPDIDMYLPQPVKKPKAITEYEIPERMPHIADLFVLDNGYLLVVTFENESASPTLAGDLFDEKGVYRNRIEVPKYYRWDFLLAPLKGLAINRKDSLYTVESNAGEDDFALKRYKLILD